MFDINRSSGLLKFLSAPKYKLSGNNIYNVEISAIDSLGKSSNYQLNVILTDKSPPIIFNLRNKMIKEKTLDVHAFTSNEKVKWTIYGGLDQDLLRLFNWDL